MITINKECVDAYLEMSEIQKQIESIESNLEAINHENLDSVFIKHSYEIQNINIVNLYKKHKNLIEFLLKEEVKKLKEKLNEYKIE